ncbi:unnamed protein product [Dovyalis caffra]|uniref:Uncharacterized protein n=1 Tax=Dovyalis caffra TaxID=77055 RepID=A0AAV1RG32_9ROSI|nr:unnamed protein product [Dovyalis caffra]
MFNNPAYEKAIKVRRYMDSRPLVRQGALAQRRSNFHGNQFPLTSEAARKAAVAPFRNRNFGRNFVGNSNNARYNAMQFGKFDELCHMVFRLVVSSHSFVEFQYMTGWVTSGPSGYSQPVPGVFCCLDGMRIGSQSFRSAAYVEFLQVLIDCDAVWSGEYSIGFRAGGFIVQRRATNGAFATKSSPHQNQQQLQGDGGAKQRPQTLDSLFANMKEQRTKVFSRQNNAMRYNGGGRRPRVPWARGRF